MATHLEELIIQHFGVSAEQLSSEARLISSRFAALRAADSMRAQSIAQYVTSRHEKPELIDAAAPVAACRVSG